MKFSYIAVCQKFRKVPPRDRRRQARRGSTASARCTIRETTVVVVPFDFRSLRSFPSVPSLALSGFFRPSLHGRYPASSPDASRMTFGLRCSQPACRPHPASLPVRIPTVKGLLHASFSFPLQLSPSVAPCASLRLPPFIQQDSAHAGHTGADAPSASDPQVAVVIRRGKSQSIRISISPSLN